METGSIKFEGMLGDINRLKAEKCRLHEKLNAVRFENKRKHTISVAASRRRAAMEIMLANKAEHLKIMQHRVAQDTAQLAVVRGVVAAKRECVKQRHAQVRLTLEKSVSSCCIIDCSIYKL